MIKTTLFTMLLALSTSAFAESGKSVTCEVKNLKQAKKCMNRLAATLDPAEEENDGFASDQKQLLVQILKAQGHQPKAVQTAKSADFVGGILVHGDEHFITYYTLNKGAKVSPQEVGSLEIVDMAAFLQSTDLEAESELTNPDTYFFGLPASNYDVEEDITYQIGEALAHPTLQCTFIQNSAWDSSVTVYYGKKTLVIQHGDVEGEQPDIVETYKLENFIRRYLGVTASSQDHGGLSVDIRYGKGSITIGSESYQVKNCND
jgi:hypothetical protein